MPFLWWWVGIELNLANMFTKNAMFGLVYYARYNKTLIAFRYGTFGLSISLSSFVGWNKSFLGLRYWKTLGHLMVEAYPY